MSETVFDEMKRYVRFGETDEACLRAIGVLAEPHLERVAREFYDRIREHEQAQAVFTGEAQIERLQRSLVLWMRRLFSGPHDEAYYTERARVGRTHVRIGLPQRYMFTAMALIRVALQRITEELPAAERQPSREALDRALDIELAIMLETYCEDLTARVERAEHAHRLGDMARSERPYADAVELARLLVVGVDADGHIGLYNQEAERVTGRRAHELTGRDVGELFPESLRESTAQALSRFARGEEPLPERWLAPVTTVAGHERLVEWRLARIVDAPVGEVALIATGHDITEESSREARVRRAEKLAAVGTLAAGLAHEIRNPLNGALLHVTFLERAMKKEGVGEEARAALGFVGDEIRRLSALVVEFLAFARPSEPERRPTSVQTLCRRSVDVVVPLATTAHAEIRADLSTTDTVLSIDEAKIEQVLLNLLGNAIDAVAANGGGHVTLRERRRPREVQLEVEDDGPGIARADAPIFDAFYTTKTAGTGLGLSIVHRIITDHGGAVTFESRPGRTVFRVLLPIVQSNGGSA